MVLIKKDGECVGDFEKKIYGGTSQSKAKSIQPGRHSYTADHVTRFKSNEE